MTVTNSFVVVFTKPNFTREQIQLAMARLDKNEAIC